MVVAGVVVVVGAVIVAVIVAVAVAVAVVRAGGEGGKVAIRSTVVQDGGRH